MGSLQSENAHAHVRDTISKNKVQFVDLRFTDIQGKEQHISINVDVVDDEFLRLGKVFDGSSIAGWRFIHESDMILKPDLQTAFLDPFFEEPTLVLRCNVIDPATMQGYTRDPRALAQRAENYLKDSHLGDLCHFGPEPEFFIFDDVRWQVDMQHTFVTIDSEEAAWNSNKTYQSGNLGHRPPIKGGYFPLPPVDACQDIRSAICKTLKKLGMPVEAHHHEVATAGQNEVSIRFNSLLKKADELQIFKYVVRNVARLFGKTATFMPRPLSEDNGNGMHCHLSIAKNGANQFAEETHVGLSQFARYFIGGVMAHAKSLNAFTNPTTNSYKRLVPGFEAPVVLAYSHKNRSAAIRIPHAETLQAVRIEVRFPDPMANPYVAFSAILMAGLDGVKKHIDPGEPTDRDLYALSTQELSALPCVCSSLEQALQALQDDCDFLLEGDVFNRDFIEAYVQLKMAEVKRMRRLPHPAEFQMYYSN